MIRPCHAAAPCNVTISVCALLPVIAVRLWFEDVWQVERPYIGNIVESVLQGPQACQTGLSRPLA